MNNEEENQNHFWVPNGQENVFHQPQPQQSARTTSPTTNYYADKGGFTYMHDGHGGYIPIIHPQPNTEDRPTIFAGNNFMQAANFNYHHFQQQPQEEAPRTTNMLINQLVTRNWSPNISGTYTPFGTAPIVNDAIPQQQQQFHQAVPQPSQSMNLPNAGVKKQRIVAEVKPMRMSYSDVLSKNVAINSNPNSNVSSKAPSPNPMNGTPILKPGKTEKPKTGYGRRDEDKYNRKNGPNSNNSAASVNTQTKKSSNPVVGGNASQMKPITSEKNTAPIKGKFGKNGKSKQKSSIKKFPEYGIDDENLPENEDTNEEEDDETSLINDENDDDDGIYDEFIYNVKKNSVQNDTHIEKIPSKSTHNLYKKVKNIKSSASKQEKSSSINLTSTKRNARSKKNQKYAFLEKMLSKWMEYSLLILIWLWSLVSDVIYLSFRIIADKLMASYQHCKQYFDTIKRELVNNSGRPGMRFSATSVWFKNLWKKIDGKFDKDSKWAFWRARKKPVEPMKTYYKDGKLPTTADEAMSSLLNCKGKDAYSILGVSPECSQEQIRKHYKKIAVLVHPDKNKQPGAEEAFKVLQRSFELIGEPENRKSYDQSLAEALNAEKAWSEINDLLTQLHTKISEAANTIRCSSCCLRHPRKPTGRPHYAARDCSSCKIRHSAREGDIWAETSFFGLRWKYLALMEGNVYDITEWANCQKGALSHLQPNSHIVQYRIVLGGNNQQQEKEKPRKEEPPPSETNLDDFLNNIYAGQNQQQQNPKRRHRRN